MKLPNCIRKEPVAVVAVIISLVLGVLNGSWFWKLIEGDIVATVYTVKDSYGRCGDAELTIENHSNKPVYNIRAPITVDYFATRGAYDPFYRSLRDLLIPPNSSPYVPQTKEFLVQYEFDPKNLVLRIPKLNPEENVHLKYSEDVRDHEQYSIREKLIFEKNADLSSGPQFGPMSHDGGKLKIVRKFLDGCVEAN